MWPADAASLGVHTGFPSGVEQRQGTLRHPHLEREKLLLPGIECDAVPFRMCAWEADSPQRLAEPLRLFTLNKHLTHPGHPRVPARDANDDERFAFGHPFLS